MITRGPLNYSSKDGISLMEDQVFESIAQADGVSRTESLEYYQSLAMMTGVGRLFPSEIERVAERLYKHFRGKIIMSWPPVTKPENESPYWGAVGYDRNFQP